MCLLSYFVTIIAENVIFWRYYIKRNILFRFMYYFLFFCIIWILFSNHPTVSTSFTSSETNLSNPFTSSLLPTISRYPMSRLNFLGSRSRRNFSRRARLYFHPRDVAQLEPIFLYALKLVQLLYRVSRIVNVPWNNLFISFTINDILFIE